MVVNKEFESRNGSLIKRNSNVFRTVVTSRGIGYVRVSSCGIEIMILCTLG